ncbi:MAG: hypothetical protein ABSC06_05640 [Rhodopila sp.]
MGVLILLAILAASLWLLTRFHRGHAREWIAGAVAVLAILWLQYAIVAAGWLGSIVHWLAGFIPFGSNQFEQTFSNDDFLPTWLANVLLLAIAGALWSIWHLFDRRRVQETELPECLVGKPLKRLALWMLLVVAFAAFFGSHLVVAAATYGFVEPFATHLRGVLWAAPLVFGALLYGATRKVPGVPPTVTQRRSAYEPSLPPPRICELIAYLGDVYKDHVLIAPAPANDKRSSGPSVTASTDDRLLAKILHRLQHAGDLTRLTADTSSALTEVFGNFWGDLPARPGDPPWSAWNVLLTEDLAQAHLLMMIELMQSCHDRGRTVLVLAPAWTIARIKRSMEAAGEADWSDITLRSFLLGSGPIDTERQYNVIFASDEMLEAGLMANPQDAVAHFLDLLELLIVFDFHLLEAAMLRLRLQRLRRLLERSQLPIEIRVVCQTENRATAGAAMRDTFEPLGTQDVRIARPIVDQATRHIVVWRGDEAALLALARQELGRVPRGQPVEVAPLAAIPPLRFDLRPGYLDSAGRWDRELWRTTLPSLLGGRLNGCFLFNDVFLGEDRFPEREVSNLIVEDRGNLADAVFQHRNFAGRQEYVLTIVAHRYPLRDWFIDLFRSGTIRDRRLLPIAPAPRGGLTELAMILAEEFGRPQAVMQSSLDDRFFNLVEPRTADAFDLFPTPRGVSTLFRSETGQELEVVAEADGFHEITFKRATNVDPPRPPLLMLPAIQQSDPKPLFRLAPGDNGLRYAVGTTLHSGGQNYRIDSVTRNRVGVGAANAPIRLSRNAFLFHRQYRVDFAASPAVLALENINWRDQGAGRVYWRLELRGAFARYTAARARIEETAPPFSPNPPRWENADVKRHPRYAALLLLRLEFGAGTPADEIPADRKSAAAFTLAATMQDVLGSLFPPLAHRIAVVSPQAKSAVDATLNDDEGSSINRFPADLYPRLVPDFCDDRLMQRSNPPLDNQADIDGFLANNGVPPPDPADSCIHLLMIEDADHDLGIVRALFSQDDMWDRLLYVWSEFLRWLVTHRDDKDLYYRFGSPSLSTCFAFEEASKLLNMIA